MAKIGTAHVEIKPVLNEEALAAIVQRIEDEVDMAIDRLTESDTVAGCAHENVRTFRSHPPHSKCEDCGSVVEQVWATKRKPGIKVWRDGHAYIDGKRID